MYFLLGMAPSQSYLAQLHHLEGQSSLVEEPVNPTPRYMVQKPSWIFTFFYLNTFSLENNPPLSVSWSETERTEYLTSAMKDKVKVAGSTNQMLSSGTLTLMVVTQRSRDVWECTWWQHQHRKSSEGSINRWWNSGHVYCCQVSLGSCLFFKPNFSDLLLILWVAWRFPFHLS